MHTATDLRGRVLSRANGHFLRRPLENGPESGPYEEVCMKPLTAGRGGWGIGTSALDAYLGCGSIATYFIISL